MAVVPQAEEAFRAVALQAWEARFDQAWEVCHFVEVPRTHRRWRSEGNRAWVVQAVAWAALMKKNILNQKLHNSYLTKVRTCWLCLVRLNLAEGLILFKYT